MSFGTYGQCYLWLLVSQSGRVIHWKRLSYLGGWLLQYVTPSDRYRIRVTEYEEFLTQEENNTQELPTLIEYQYPDLDNLSEQR